MRASFTTLAPKRSADQARLYVASAAPCPLEVFVARAEARTLLYAAGEVTLHASVDGLQLAAERDGLLAKLGQDEIQRIMAAAFARVRDGETWDLRSATNCGSSFDAESFWDAPSWREAAQQYHANRPSPPDRQTIERARRLLDDNVSLERAWQHEINARSGRAAQSTVDAIMFSLRDGVRALSRPDTLRRLSELDDLQLREVVVRLLQFKTEIAEPWTPEGVGILLAVRRKLHER